MTKVRCVGVAFAITAATVVGVASSASADSAVQVASATEMGGALDLPSGVAVTLGGTSAQMFGTTSRAYNDFPRKGGNPSYAVVSTGRASDLFNMDLPGLQPSTSFGGSPDKASLTFEVAQGTAAKCLLVDVAMATEERVHTYLPSAPSDVASLKLNGVITEYAKHPGARYFEQQDLPSEPTSFSVAGIDYWHEIDEEFERQPDDVDAPLLAPVTPFDHFTSVETLSVPLDANDATQVGPDTVTLSIEDASNNALDTALMIDRVRLAAECASSASAQTGLFPSRGFAIVGQRGVNNTLTVDLDPSTSVIERYDGPDNSWFPTGQVDLRFRWYRGTCSSMPNAETPIPDADRQSYSPTIEDKGKCLMVLVTGMKDGFRSETFPGPSNWSDAVTLAIQDGVFTSKDAPTISSPSGISVVRVGDTLTASNGEFYPRPDSYEYQWFSGDSLISGATGPSLTVTAAQAGEPIRVRVTAARLNFDKMPVFSVATPAVQLLDFVTTPNPSISGTGRVGDVLTADPKTWAPVPSTVKYQWFSDAAPITGATRSTYTPTASQVGKAVTVSVTGTRAGYATATRQSAPTTITQQGFSAPTPVLTNSSGAPVQSGLAGDSLKIQLGTWTPSPTTRTYQWFDDDGAITGANSSSYTPRSDQRGKRIYVEVTGTRDGYQTTTLTSNAVGIDIRQFAGVPTPTITGSAKVGSTLTGSAGAWEPRPTLKYQWLVGSKVLGTSTRLTVPPEAVGKRIRFVVTGSKTNYETKVAVRDTAVVAAGTLTVTTPRASGSARPGGVLRASASWRPSPVTYRYQWYVGSKAIKGATKSSYKIPKKYRNKKIRVRVIGTKSGYTTAVRYSAFVRVAKK